MPTTTTVPVPPRSQNVHPLSSSGASNTSVITVASRPKQSSVTSSWPSYAAKWKRQKASVSVRNASPTAAGRTRIAHHETHRAGSGASTPTGVATPTPKRLLIDHTAATSGTITSRPHYKVSGHGSIAPSSGRQRAARGKGSPVLRPSPHGMVDNIVEHFDDPVESARLIWSRMSHKYPA